MSAANDRSIGEELVRIIRAEIAAYDRRKDDAVRLRKVADQAVAEADRAATNARDSKPDPITAAFKAFAGDPNAQAIDALFKRRQKPHVDFTTTVSAVSVDELLRQQQQCAEKTTAWKPRDTGENLPRRRWWQRAKS
ncbi:hypothetical protein [Mycobacteroides franklinii]|uniref:hypothetical protein n=1 Tax=Mycobacteroides franklinii TaxID=948102 RepID=UPI000993AD72|nr:hypothetical protein [Mycobacteroides franklinii]ORA64137.1 hypothetical protein BST24_02950 [Mycobacteroides franklinii]